MKYLTKLFGIIMFFLVLISCNQNQVKTPTVTMTTASQPTQVETVGSPTNSEFSVYPIVESEGSITYPAGFDNYKTIISVGNLKPPKEAQTPVDGFASVSGLLFQTQGSMVLKNLDFFLAPAVTVGDKKIIPPIITYPDSSKGDVIGRTDDNGIFDLNNVPAGDYYLIINFPDRSVVAHSGQTLGSYLLISVTEDSQIPLGILFIND